MSRLRGRRVKPYMPRYTPHCMSPDDCKHKVVKKAPVVNTMTYLCEKEGKCKDKRLIRW